MGSILCVTSGLTGILHASLELAQRLSAAGHELHYASYPDVRQMVESHGLPFLPLAASQYGEFLTADAEKGSLERLRRLSSRREAAIQAMKVDEFADLVRTVHPDLLLMDVEMHEHIIAAQPTGVPMALLSTFTSLWKRPGLPPAHHLAQPGVGFKGSKIGTALLWGDLRWRKWFRSSWLRARHVGCDRLSLLRQLGDSVGFDLSPEADFGQWLIPFTYKRFPILILHALEFEFPHQPTQGAYFLGPMVPEDRQDRNITTETRVELERLFDRRRRSAGKRKLIYAGFGSGFTTGMVVVQRLIEAVAEREDWDLVISLGNKSAPAELEFLPANVHAFAWVPQTSVLRHADVAVNHGGINTIDESIIFETPMLIFCGFETDMGGSTARVLYHQVGIVGDPRRDSPQAIGRYLERLLTEPQFAANVDRLRSCYLAYADHRVAERVVDSLLEKAQRERPSKAL